MRIKFLEFGFEFCNEFVFIFGFVEVIVVILVEIVIDVVEGWGENIIEDGFMGWIVVGC